MQFLQDGKRIIFDYNDINENDLCQNHRVIKGARALPLDKLSKEIYSILISNIVNKQLQTFISKNCLKIQLLIGIKFTCHHV